MRFLVSLLFLIPAGAWAAALPYFSVLSDDAGGWPRIFSAVGFQPQAAGKARIFVLRPGALGSPDWTARVENGAVVILEGESPAAELFGFRREKENARVGSLEDVHRPGLAIIWEKALELPRYSVPKQARVFAWDKWSKVPVMAGYRLGSGAVLWVIASPGERGYERFPYLLHALGDLGVEPPFRSDRLWAFFDHSYRLRVDLDYFAARWRRAGITALHVAAWHFYDRDRERDQYLERLIAACHRQGVLVYAWLELPHVSEKFWNDHPEWREKTGVLQDAHLDWRKLMNLTNRDCFRAAAAGIQDLMRRFDWDGANVAELYFESLEGLANPARFTPMNDDVRAQFRRSNGFDPIEIFQKHDEARQRQFLEFRAGLAREMQREWLGVLEDVRHERRWLDLVLTHVDDRLDTGMRDAIGADSEGALKVLGPSRGTFLVEDPATVWNQGPERYTELARRYRERGATGNDGLAIDINIVERYQDVYPTKQQTGTELFQLVHFAAKAFPRVALYAEHSLLAPDVDLLSSAAAGVRRVERMGPKLVIDSEHGVGVPWSGDAMVDGKLWPVVDGRTAWLPSGAHTVEAATSVSAERPRALRFTGDLQTAEYLNNSTIEIAYSSKGRAAVVLSGRPLKFEVDGAPGSAVEAGEASFLLPRGQHIVTFQFQ